MRTAVAACFLLTLCAFTAGTVRAQEDAPSERPRTEVSLREAARLSVRPALRAKVVLEDTVSAIRTRRVDDGRVDEASGVYRARYRVRERVPASLPPERAAVEHLVRSASTYGIAAATEQLQVESVRGGAHARHVHLRQTLAGVPVYGRDITVSLDARGQPTMVVNGYAGHLEHVTSFDPIPSISAARAVRIVQSASERDLETTDPELVVYPSKPPRLAWKVAASSEVLPVSWLVLVDARTGEVIQMLDVTMHGGETVDRSRLDLPAGSVFASSIAGPAVAAVSMAAPRIASSSTTVPSLAQVDGTGYAFDPDPLTSAGVSYGGDYVDGNDADTPALNGELFTVTLRDISQGTDGMYRLEGPFVRIVGDEEAVPLELSPHAFTYTRADDRFEAVNAYYHIDKSQRYVQSLGFTELDGFPIKDEPVRVDPQAFPADDSNFNPGQNIIRFGTGGIDDGEDADVIWHEYAHALLDFTTPGLTASNFEGSALHEGWADYWAASYSRYLSEEDPQIPDHDWRRLYSWDGNLPCWQGRTLDHAGHYPDDASYQASGCQVIGDIYQWGLLWATTLMDIYPQVGRKVLDRLNLASHAYLASSSNFADAAEALIQADNDLYGGAHGSILVKELGETGYIDPLNYGPIIEHEPLKASEQTGGSMEVEVTATPTTASVDSVLVVHAVDEGPFGRMVLERTSGNRYEGNLALPEEPSTIRYYIEAVDVEGRRRRLPNGAPLETYVFDVGPDDEPPSIVHTAPDRASVIAWPIDLFADVDDNLGIDSVWVEYTLRAPDGTARETGAFGLESTDGVYSGRFPSPASPILDGDRADFRIVARDASAAGHETSLPAEGTFSIEIVENGVLRAFNFEGLNEGFTSDGLWAAGKPSYGLRVAHSGENVWATTLGAAYPAAAGRSGLELPALNLEGLGPVYLIFWHWYDFEHNGLAMPGEYNQLAGIWDGGNVNVSTDGGKTWRVLEPQDRYNGSIGDDFGNPLGGQPGFGGYSYGWRREIVDLPTSKDVRIRFEFGTDDSNDQESLFFAGWHIDDIEVTTQLPTDSDPPDARALPPQRMVHVAGQEAPPSIEVEVVDDTGVEAVISEYEILSGGETASGTLRLAMSGTDATIYEGVVAPIQSFEPGDRIEYTLRIRDFDGNEAVYGDPFVIDFRSEQSLTALQAAVATGAWQLIGGRWTASGSVSQPTSSLVLEPFTLPSNSEHSDLVLEHAYILGGDFGGNVKISTDDGATWTVLTPETGYPSTFSAETDHPMAGQPVFAGATDGSIASVFDLSSHVGRSIRLRVDLAHMAPIEASEGWTISRLAYRSRSADDEFRIDGELALHANFPDPVADRTTISYTVPGEATIPVRLAVYDLLGRRVALIRHARHVPGTYTLQYDASELANGLYILYLETTLGTRTERMVVVR